MRFIVKQMLVFLNKVKRVNFCIKGVGNLRGESEIEMENETPKDKD